MGARSLESRSRSTQSRTRSRWGLCGPAIWADVTVGFVLLGAFGEPGVATIVYIGVLPESRGLGYVHELLAAATMAAGERGFERILSDVDTENIPMRAAMGAAGHLPNRRPWHVWHYRRTI